MAAPHCILSPASLSAHLNALSHPEQKFNYSKKKCSLFIFKQIIRPILTYACPVWGNCASSHIKKMQIVQNKVLRIIANAPWFVRNANLHKDFQIQEIEDHVKSLAKHFHCSLPNSSGAIHYNLLIHPTHRRLKRGHPTLSHSSTFNSSPYICVSPRSLYDSSYL